MCSLVFQFQPGSVLTDHSWVAYIILFLARRAREWGTAMWNADSPNCFDIQNFTNELIEVFDREAACETLQMRQGRKMAPTTSTSSPFWPAEQENWEQLCEMLTLPTCFDSQTVKFLTLAISCGWNQQAQYGVFIN